MCEHDLSSREDHLALCTKKYKFNTQKCLNAANNPSLYDVIVANPTAVTLLFIFR